MAIFRKTASHRAHGRAVRIIPIALAALALGSGTGFAVSLPAGNQWHRLPAGPLPGQSITVEPGNLGKSMPPIVGALAQQDAQPQSIRRPSIVDGFKSESHGRMNSGNDFNWLGGGGGG